MSVLVEFVSYLGGNEKLEKITMSGVVNIKEEK